MIGEKYRGSFANMVGIFGFENIFQWEKAWTWSTGRGPA
jgi:hypothetical protein